MSSVAAAAASTATTVGGSEASRAGDGFERADRSIGPAASPGGGSLAPLQEPGSLAELGTLPDSPSALAPPEDQESQTTYGSWQEEAPRPVDLARAVSFVAPSEPLPLPLPAGAPECSCVAWCGVPQTRRSGRCLCHSSALPVLPTAPACNGQRALNVLAAA